MDPETLKNIKERLQKGETSESIKTGLIESGFLEEDADMAIAMAEEGASGKESKESRKVLSRVSLKDVLDRVGFGFSSQQYLNILFLLSGASYFLIGIISGLKTLLAVLYSSILDEHVGSLRRYKHILFRSGIIYGATFLLLIYSYMKTSPLLFALGLLIGAIAAVANGTMYYLLLNKLAGDIRHLYLSKMNKWGIALTALSMILAGYLLQYLKHGASAVFLISALAFILGSAVINGIREPLHERSHSRRFWEVALSHYREATEHLGEFVSNRILLTLLITGAITSAVQALGGAFYGIFIFQSLRSQGFGAYLNVALIFVFALVGTYLGSFITQQNAKEYGKFPMLTFGTVLIALLPLTYWYNASVVPMAMATMLGMIGANIVGIARSILTVELLKESERKEFFKVSSVLTTLPYVFFIPAGALIAQKYGLQALFLILGLSLLVVVMPLYFAIVITYNKKAKV